MRRGGRGRDLAFMLLAGLGVCLALLPMLVLVGDVVLDGMGKISLHFLSSFASRFPERAGIRAPLAGTLWLLGLTAVLAVPVSVGAAIYLEEYATRTWFTRMVRANITNLAGVPSIVYGILGLALFVRAMDLGRSVISGALTLSFLILPIIIVATQEALRRVPKGVREAAYGLGATRWEVIRFQVLPQAIPGILSGVILALARAAGETAPLIMVGAVTFIAFTPEAATDPYTALPVQIFHWVTRSQDGFRGLAAAGIIVLLTLILSLNGLAVILRNRLEKGEMMENGKA